MCIIIKIKLVVTCRLTCFNIQLQCIGMFIARCLIIYLDIFRIQTCSSGIYYCRIGKSFQFIDCIRSRKSGITALRIYRYQLIQSCCVSQASVWTCGICYGKIQGSFQDSYFCFTTLILDNKIIGYVSAICVLCQRKICRCKSKFLLFFIAVYVNNSTLITFENNIFELFFYNCLGSIRQSIITCQSSLYVNAIRCIIYFCIVVLCLTCTCYRNRLFQFQFIRIYFYKQFFFKFVVCCPCSYCYFYTFVRCIYRYKRNLTGILIHTYSNNCIVI